MRDVHANEFAKGFNVAAHAPELRAKVRSVRTAVSGADGINEDKVRLVKPRVLIVLELIRWGRHRSVVEHLYSLWTHRSHMHEHRCRSRSAIECECQRS